MSKKNNKPSSDSGDQMDVDMGAIDKLLNKKIDEDIELTDADMNDPELLSMLSHIESGGNLPKSTPQRESGAVLTAKVPAKPVQREDDDDDEDLDKLMDDDDIDIDDLMDDKPKKKKVSSPQQQQETQAQPYKGISYTVEQLEGLVVSYKKHALALNQGGNQAEAIKFIKASKQIENSIQDLAAGKQVDLSGLPHIGGAAQSTAAAATTTTTTTPTKPVQQQQPVKTTTPTRSATTPVTTPTQPKLDLISRERIEHEERVQVWELLEQDYSKRYHLLTSEALRLKETDKITAITYLKQSKSIHAILDQIQHNKSLNPPAEPPSFHFEEKTKNEETQFLNLKENEVEFHIHSPVQFDKVFGSSDIYITGEFPYPEQGQKFQTPTFNSKSPLDFKTKFIIERKKSYARTLEKKKLSMQLFASKMFFMKSVLGKVEVKLSDLLSKCEISEKVPILKEGTKRETGAFLTMTIRMRTPLTSREVKTVTEKCIVLDSDIEVSEEIKAKNGLSGKPTTTSTSITTSQQTTTVQQPVSKPTPQPAKPTPQPAKPQVQQPVSKPQPQVQQPVAKPTPPVQQPQTQPQPQPQPVSKPTPQVQQPQQPQPPVSKPTPQEEEEDEVEYDSVERVVSNNVLESMLENVKLQIQKQGAKPEFLEQKQAIEIKLQVLEVQVQSGMLTIEGYIKQVESAIESDKKLAMKLNSKGEKEKALKVMQRIKTMKSELEESG